MLLIKVGITRVSSVNEWLELQRFKPMIQTRLKVSERYEPMVTLSNLFNRKFFQYFSQNFYFDLHFQRFFTFTIILLFLIFSMFLTVFLNFDFIRIRISDLIIKRDNNKF